MQRRYPIALALMLGLLTASAVAEEQEFPAYFYPGQKGYGYEFAPAQLRLRWRESGEVPDAGVWRTVDCSTASLRCLSADRWFFAVPRESLSVGQHFRVGAWEVRPLGCMAVSPTGGCSTFVFQAVNVEGPRKIGPDLTPIPRSIVYVFDIERGIVAFEDASEWPQPIDVSSWDIDSIGTTAAMYTLQGQYGLFAKERGSKKSH